ncbi:hypothetical protein FOMPIDRAFT_1051599 [Fomitopsis schrenkii]|uniref:F-box domain-containing protein n=1 Tax=Fomitopsis schrenkii TaxID=2126942 RepID=S8DZH1_FOMSC|nr:hypothetical protein FOMPIDRAFT_1051599 [Fomitopsis schrenkii]
MSLCTVDFDTLSIIVAFLSPDDARSLSRTTRALHAIAQQRALSALTIRKPQVLTQAHKYLLDDIPARAHCLRELTVSFGAHNTTLEQVSPLVADLLENTPLLKHVSIDCAEDLILIEPRLWNALTALKFVTNVELIGAGPEVLRQLGELQGPLRRLAFRGQIEERLPPNQMPTIRLPFVDFVKAWHSYPHLKSVVLCDIGSLDDHPKEHRYAPCPNVTNLEVLRSYLAPSDMNAMFPNLRTLSFCHTGRPRADSTARSPEKCWTRLDSIRFRTVYAPKVHPWPLTSRVRRLDLVNVIETDTETYWSFPDIYLGVVERTQPIVLRLSTCPSIGENFWKRVLMAQRNVRCLDIRVRTNWRCHKDLGGWLDKVPTFWAESSLVYVRFSVHEPDFLSEMRVPEALQYDSDRAMTYARETISARLFAGVPSLRMLAVKLPDNISWWRIQHAEDNGERNLLPISRDVGRRVEAYLYSEEYERKLTFDGE